MVSISMIALPCGAAFCLWEVRLNLQKVCIRANHRRMERCSFRREPSALQHLATYLAWVEFLFSA